MIWCLWRSEVLRGISQKIFFLKRLVGHSWLWFNVFLALHVRAPICDWNAMKVIRSDLRLGLGLLHTFFLLLQFPKRVENVAGSVGCVSYFSSTWALCWDLCLCPCNQVYMCLYICGRSYCFLELWILASCVVSRCSVATTLNIMGIWLFYRLLVLVLHYVYQVIWNHCQWSQKFLPVVLQKFHIFRWVFEPSRE